MITDSVKCENCAAPLKALKCDYCGTLRSNSPNAGIVLPYYETLLFKNTMAQVEQKLKEQGIRFSVKWNEQWLLEAKAKDWETISVGIIHRRDVRREFMHDLILGYLKFESWDSGVINFDYRRAEALPFVLKTAEIVHDITGKTVKLL